MISWKMNRGQNIRDMHLKSSKMKYVLLLPFVQYDWSADWKWDQYSFTSWANKEPSFFMRFIGSSYSTNCPSPMARTFVQSITVGILWATVITVQLTNSVRIVLCRMVSVALSIDAVAGNIKLQTNVSIPYARAPAAGAPAGRAPGAPGLGVSSLRLGKRCGGSRFLLLVTDRTLTTWEWIAQETQYCILV